MDNLPFPRTRTGWILSAWLIAISFVFYYCFVFSFLSEKYNRDFWQPQIYQKAGGSLLLKLQVPRHLSNFVPRELVLRAWTDDDKPIDPFSITIVAGKLEPNKSCPSYNSNMQVLFCSQLDGGVAVGCNDGSNTIKFDRIPPHGQVVHTLWMISDSSQGQLNQPEPTFGIWKEPNDPTTNPETCLPFRGTAVNTDTSPFSTNPYLVSLITLLQSLLHILLLPPWANGLIPALVLFVVYLREHKIQPRKETMNWRTSLKQCFLNILSDAGKTKPARFFADHLGKFLSNQDAPKQAKLINCSKHFASLLVSLLYFSLAIIIFVIPVIFSGNGVDFWWGLWVILLAATCALLMRYVLHQCATCPDLDKNGDPICLEDIDWSDPDKDALNQIANTLQEIRTNLTGMTDNKGNCAFLEDSTKQVEAHLSALKETLTRIGTAFDKWIKTSDANSPKITACSFTPQTILLDKAAASLLAKALKTTSREQVKELLKDTGFALRMLSLLVADGQSPENLQIDDGEKISEILISAAVLNKNSDDKILIVDQWLNEIPDLKYANTLIAALNKNKDKEQVKDIENIEASIILGEKGQHNIENVVKFLADYVTQKVEAIDSSGIKWNEIVKYLVSQKRLLLNDLNNNIVDKLIVILSVNNTGNILSKPQVVPDDVFKQFRDLLRDIIQANTKFSTWIKAQLSDGSVNP